MFLLRTVMYKGTEGSVCVLRDTNEPSPAVTPVMACQIPFSWGLCHFSSARFSLHILLLTLSAIRFPPSAFRLPPSAFHFPPFRPAPSTVLYLPARHVVSSGLLSWVQTCCPRKMYNLV